MQEQVSVQLRLRASPPTLQAAVVRRSRLDERLDRSVELPVTLVSAAPGSGKTMAIASWLAGRVSPGPAAWLALDRSDNDLRTFWSDVLSALVASGALAETALREVLPAAGFGAAEALKVRAGLSTLPGPVVLVLDDVHLLTDPAVLQSLDRLLEDQTSALRLVLITRVDPPLKLRRLRLNAQLGEIRAADLAFTDLETAELFDRSGVELSPRQLELLHARTQGWPAGVRLAALSLDPADVDAGIERFSGTERSVAEYLVGEILDGLTPQDREFLLRTGIVERISAGLATALTGQANSQAVLERLAAANALVVALAGGTEWFGYHPLLRDLLAHRLELEQPGVSAGLHLQASRWFVAHDEPIPGIRHASLAQDWTEVGRILMFSGAPLLVTPDAAALAAALRPAAARSAGHPSWSTLVAAAACHFQGGDLDSMRLDVIEARQFLSGQPEEISRAGEIYLAMLTIPYSRGRAAPEVLVQTCGEALRLLDHAPRRLAPAGRPFRVVADNNMAVGLLWCGEFDQAARRFGTAEVQAREFRLGLTELNVQAHLAVLDTIHGRLRSAAQRAQDLQVILDRRGWGSEGTGTRYLPDRRAGQFGLERSRKSCRSDRTGTGGQCERIGPGQQAGAGHRCGRPRLCPA